MSLDDIKAIPVAGVCTPDAHLWLWTTNTHLPEALEVVTAWGFQYKTLRTWDKGRMGLGWWLRSQTEHIIFAVRSNRYRQEPGAITTLFRAPWRGHSSKPMEELQPIIERLSPGPYLEMFASADRGWPGWSFLVSNALPVGDPYGQG